MQFFSNIAQNLVLLTLLLAPIQQDLVACIGADGHQEIEISSMGNCFSCLGVDDHDLKPSETDPDADHCGDCTDIPLTSNPAQVKNKPILFDVPADLQSPLQRLLLALDRHHSDPTTLPNPPPAQTVLASLKTIILLI